MFGHFESKDDSSITRDCFNGPWDCLVEYGSKNGSSPRDCVGRQHMNKVTVLRTACCILINSGNGPWDCCLVNMLRRTAAVPESYDVQLYEYGGNLGACCLVTLIQKTTAISPGTVLTVSGTVWSAWFEEGQQSQELCCAPPYE